MPRSSNLRPPGIIRFPAAKQRRLDALLEKNIAGTITSREKARLERLVADAEKLMVENGKRLLKISQSAGASQRPDAVPVTVWVSTEAAE